MPQQKKIRVGILGASGYTGADAIRLCASHPNVELTALAAETHAGKALDEVFPHLGFIPAPRLIKASDVRWDDCDAVISGLPHSAAQDIIAGLPGHLRIIDMSADFRFSDAAVYQKWYGREHGAPHLLQEAVYGLSEPYAPQIAAARLVACPGCYPTAVLLGLLPLAAGGLISVEDIIIDAKSGVSGAGRSLKQNTLFCEAGEGFSPYGVASHRHAPEIEHQIGRAAGASVTVTFTPHLAPMSRGELVTCYVRLAPGTAAADLKAALAEAYADKPFIRFSANGRFPGTQYVRGSNYCLIGVYADRVPGRAIVIAAIDNLVKGSAGQALQNFNLMFGLDETAGLTQQPLFP
jgi:N-acetyl-gamma-glutamyl-phosphate reductase